MSAIERTSFWVLKFVLQLGASVKIISTRRVLNQLLHAPPLTKNYAPSLGLISSQAETPTNLPALLSLYPINPFMIEAEISLSKIC